MDVLADTTVSDTETVEIPAFDFTAFMNDTDQIFGITMPNWIIYALIFVFMTYIYNKVFRARKLPLLKDLIVYIMLALGSFLLLIFEADSSLPIVYCLTVAVGLMFTLRIRYFVTDLKKKK